MKSRRFMSIPSLKAHIASLKANTLEEAGTSALGQSRRFWQSATLCHLIRSPRQQRRSRLCPACDDGWPPDDCGARGWVVRARGCYNSFVDLGASFGVLSIDQQGGANSAAVDQVEQRFGATVAPFDIDAINRDASEASRAKRAPAFVWIAKSHHRRRGRQDDRRIAMRGYRGTDHLKQLVVLCPLGDNIPAAAPEHTVCISDCLVRPLQMHHAITADDMIERLLFVGQTFRIALPEPNIRVVRRGLGDNRRREIQSFRLGTGADQRCCKVAGSTANIEHALTPNVAKRSDDRWDHLVGQRREQLVVAVCARGPSRKL